MERNAPWPRPVSTPALLPPRFWRTTLEQAFDCRRYHCDPGAVRDGWFTEGFDTRDLKEAKALLQELT
jgi:hypothetical protein